MSADNTPISIDELEMLMHQIRVAGEGISQCNDAQEEGPETRLTYLLVDTIEHKVDEASKLLRGGMREIGRTITSDNLRPISSNNERLKGVVRSVKHWTEETKWVPLSLIVTDLKREVEAHYYNCREEDASNAHSDLLCAEWRLRQAERRKQK